MCICVCYARNDSRSASPTHTLPCMLCVHARSLCAYAMCACVSRMHVMHACLVCMHVRYACMSCMHACHASPHVI